MSSVDVEALRGLLDRNQFETSFRMGRKTITLMLDEIEELRRKSAAYDELVARVESAPVGKVEVYDTPEQWTYVIVPQHFQSGQRVRLLLDAHPSDDAGDV